MPDELTRVRQELEETLVLRRRAQQVRSQLASLELEQRREVPRLRELRRRLDQERADVERVEGLSFTALILTVVGKKDNYQEKERAELAAAKLKYDAAESAAEARVAERDRLTQELATLRNVEAQYATLLADKERLLLQSTDPMAPQCVALTERLALLRSQFKELGEAVAAGERARHSVGRVREALQAALSWGRWDMVSGDLISTSIKHSHLDTAKESALAARKLIARFERELADTDIRLQELSEPDITSADRFMDLFLDNFFLDCQLQRKIEASHTSVELLERQLATALVEVTGRRGIVRSELQAVELERTVLLERA